MPRRLRRILIAVPVTLIVVGALAWITGAVFLRGSLPRLDGERELSGLADPVVVTRDALGTPTIAAAARADAARALGWLHAQDRFFQMDLLRRSAAGEVAVLVGGSALSWDRDVRRHRFRARAEAVVAAASPRERALLDAYTAGVNAGLDELRTRPFEYLVLRTKPEPWRPEDTVLVICAMFLDLSLSTADAEAAWGTVRDVLPPQLAEYLLPRAARWDAPLQTAVVPPPPVPDPAAVDVRTWSRDTLRSDGAVRMSADAVVPRTDRAGSNNWAVAGGLSGHGGALLADDMHLGHGLPNIWYRARTTWTGEDGAPSETVGVTLPGTPALIAGSNGRVAWGFTNSYGDWADLVVLETDPADSTRYRTPDGWESLVVHTEILRASDAAPETLLVAESRWGPVWSRDVAGRPLALRWTAHDVEGVNVTLIDLERTRDVDEAVAVAGSLGIPQQNLVCADADGRVAWTIAGRVPRRIGWDGRRPVSWADGTHRWDGYLAPADQPRIVDPPEGRLWTANNRTTAGADLATLGDGGYGLGARARQIRDGLRALDRPVETDLLALQLDDRALFLGEWRDLVLDVLDRRDPDADGERSADRAGFARLAADDWSGRASVDSAGYRLVRAFMYELIGEIYGWLTGPCIEADPGFDSSWLPFRHAVARDLLEARPAHLLPPDHADWDALVLAAVDVATDTAREILAANADGPETPPSLADFVWGDRNTVVVSHPLAGFIPVLGGRLAASSHRLPGDSHMPRVQHPGSGASERMVVSPGREQDGILHMPGGQSGHPLSPFFLAGHDDWARGNATPLLPGAPRHTLRLVPEGQR